MTAVLEITVSNLRQLSPALGVPADATPDELFKAWMDDRAKHTDNEAFICAETYAEKYRICHAYNLDLMKRAGVELKLTPVTLGVEEMLSNLTPYGHSLAQQKERSLA